jgi:hypothetical protein
MNLDDLTGRLELVPKRTASVDVSKWLGVDETGAPVTFVFRELGVPETFQCYADARDISALHPTWPNTLCRVIASMASSHVAPASTKPIGLVYCDFAEHYDDLFTRLSVEFAGAFPDHENLKEAAEAAKNALSTASTE